LVGLVVSINVEMTMDALPYLTAGISPAILIVEADTGIGLGG
jgi:hypothetical protein